MYFYENNSFILTFFFKKEGLCYLKYFIIKAIRNMAAKKPKRIEVLSTKVKQLVDSPESEMTFEDILIFMNGRKCYDEFKEYELKLIDTKLNNCIVGIIITGQNKNLPAKRDRATGEFYPLNLNPDKETLSFGNIFLYDKNLNILLYEVNINGCYID